MITHTMDLDVVPDKQMKTLWLSQNDENFTLIFNLYARTGTFTVEDGTTVAINGTKPDGEAYTKAATLNGTTVTVAGDADMTSADGQGVFELTLTKGSKVLNTANFIINFERAALKTT